MICNMKGVGMITRLYILDNCRSIWWYITISNLLKTWWHLGPLDMFLNMAHAFWYRDNYMWMGLIEIKMDLKYWKHASFVSKSMHLLIHHSYTSTHGGCVSLRQNFENNAWPSLGIQRWKQLYCNFLSLFSLQTCNRHNYACMSRMHIIALTILCAMNIRWPINMKDRQAQHNITKHNECQLLSMGGQHLHWSL